MISKTSAAFVSGGAEVYAPLEMGQVRGGK